MSESFSDDKPKYHVPALEKGLDILEFLSAASIPQTQAEIARALDRNTSEIFRMLDCLDSRGYLIRDQHSNRYSLSLRLYEMAHTHSPVDQLLLAAREPMRYIAESIRESVHLSILRGNEILILAQEESPEPIRISLGVGTKQAILRTASGRLLISQWEEEKQQAYLQNNSAFQKMTQFEQETLIKELAKAKVDAYLISDSKYTLGVKDITVFIGNPRLELMAALATPVLMHLGEEPDTKNILATLQEQAQIITRKVGLSYEDPVAVL